MDSHEKPADIKANKWSNVNYVDHQSTPKGDLTQFRDREVPINFGFLLKSDPFTFVHTMTEIALENNELRKEIKRLEAENEHLRSSFTNGYVHQNLQPSPNKEKLETEAPPKLSEDLIDLAFSCDEISTSNNNMIVVSNNDDDDAEEVIEIKNPVSNNGNGASHNFTIRVELVNKTSESQSQSQSPQNQQQQNRPNRQCISKGCQCQTRTRQKRKSSISNNINTENHQQSSSTRRQMIPLPYTMAVSQNQNLNPSRNISSNSKIVASNSVTSSKSYDKGQSQNKKPSNACVYAMKSEISPTPSSIKKNKRKSKSRFYKNAFNAFLGRNNNDIPAERANATSTTNYESNFNRISYPINSSIPTIRSSQNIKPRPSIYQPQSQPLKSQFSSHRRPPPPPIQFRDDPDSSDSDDLLN